MNKRSFLAVATAGFVFCASQAHVARAAEVQFAKDTPTVQMAEWEIVQKGAAEQTGARVMIAAGPAELARAPSSAARYDSQTFRFPSGEIRVLN